MPIAIIGGSGFRDWAGFDSGETLRIETPYDPGPVELQAGRLAGTDVVFLPRHGPGHSVPPHRINYRANIHALNEAGVNAVVAIGAVGSITAHAVPGSLMIPDQILDYTYGRAHTFFDGEDGRVAHADMTEPYCEALRGHLARSARDAGLTCAEHGTYAAMQGPRFETPAEIRRLERDGADVVGMTGMPEAALARELRLAYALVAVVVNPAAGKTASAIDALQIEAWLAEGRGRVETLLANAVGRIAGQVFEVPAPILP